MTAVNRPPPFFFFPHTFPSFVSSPVIRLCCNEAVDEPDDNYVLKMSVVPSAEKPLLSHFLPFFRSRRRRLETARNCSPPCGDCYWPISSFFVKVREKRRHAACAVERPGGRPPVGTPQPCDPVRFFIDLWEKKKKKLGPTPASSSLKTTEEDADKETGFCKAATSALQLILR